MNAESDISLPQGNAISFVKLHWLSLAILGGFLPLLVSHFSNLWKYDHYQYFPLVLAVIPYLIWMSRPEGSEAAAASGTSVLWERIPIGAGLAGFSVAVLFWSPNLAMASAVCTAAGLLLRLRRQGSLTHIAALCLVLLFLVRLPANLDLTLIFELQSITSRAASLLIDTIGIDHVLLGNVLWVGDKSYFVEEACSGINSLFSLTAITAIAMAVLRRGWLHSILLIIAAGVWACLTNTIRVAVLVIINERLGIDLLVGTPHTIFGLVLFGFALAMVASTDQLLLIFSKREDALDFEELDDPNRKASQDDAASQATTETTETSEHEVVPPAPEPVAADSPDRFLWLSLSVSVLLLLAQFSLLLLGRGPTGEAWQNLASGDFVIVASDLPDEIQGWKQQEFEIQKRDVVDYLGENSAVWQYQRGEQRAIVSLDYPFWHWHELTDCYRAQGDQLESRQIIEGEEQSDSVVFAKLRSIEGYYKWLAFSLFRSSGDVLDAPGDASGLSRYGFGRLDRSVHEYFLKNEPSYQLQVLIQAPGGEAPTEELVALQREAKKLVQAMLARKGEEQ